MAEQRKIALLSTDDKTDIVEIACALSKAGYDILSSGGTRRKIIEGSSIPVTDVSEWTGFPAILGHRLVTIGSKVAAGFLANMTNEEHVADMDEHGFVPIDFVYFGLYDFQERLREQGSEWEALIENMDVGGPMALAAAAKGARLVVTNPSDALKLARRLRDGEAPTREEIQDLQFKAIETARDHWTEVLNALAVSISADI